MKGDGESYRAIENVVVALLCHGQSDVGGIARSDIGLRHEESGSDLSVE